MQWDLVCERRVLYSTTQAVMQAGKLIGHPLFGFLIDMWVSQYLFHLLNVVKDRYGINVKCFIKKKKNILELFICIVNYGSPSKKYVEFAILVSLYQGGLTTIKTSTRIDPNAGS